MLKGFIVLYVVVTLVKCDKVRRRRTDDGRQGRIFTFNVQDDDIQIDLDITIPFITIPVKKTVDAVNGLMELPTININPASLVLGGAVLLGATVVLPLIVKKYATNSQDRYVRILDNAEFGADAVLEFANQMLSDSHGFRGCPLRVACWAAQQEYANPRVILDQIISNQLLSSMVNSSAVEDAMISGMHGRSCSSYGPCLLQEHHLPMILNNLAILTNSPGSTN